MSSERERSLLSCLALHAARTPNKVAIRVLGDAGVVREQTTYAELWSSVRRHASLLLSHTQPGERALLLYPTGLPYVEAFLGCFLAGVVAVPAYPPESAKGHLERLLGIVRDAAPRLVLTEERLCDAIGRGLGAHVASLPVLGTGGVLTTEAAAPRATAPEELALLQYTSGSTSSPKGVMVSHGNLSANQRAIGNAFGIDERDVIVSWLPLYHDMGMLGVLLQTIYSGCSLVLLSPQQFLRAPLRWLHAISTHGGTVSGSPDFGYRTCVERVTEDDLSRLDLSSWRLAFSGAEPIRAQTLASFADTFAAVGFRRESHYPCYGLAEATLLVTGAERDVPATLRTFAAETMEQGRLVHSDAGTLLVGCGHVALGHSVRIAELESGRVLPDGEVGEIWFSGPSVTLGYFRNAAATAETYVERDGQRYLRTGDLGARVDGELYVTGRHKDMLIVRGRNLYPQDLERAVEDALEVVRKGRVVAFSIERDGREGIVIAAEVSPALQKLAPPESLGAAITEAVATAFQEAPLVVLLVSAGALPKTSSGKLQRRATRAAFEGGTLGVYAHYERGVVVAGPRAKREVVPSALSALETRLAGFWRDVLGTEVRERDASFFALGGNSLAAAQIAARIEAELGVVLDASSLFAAPTLAGLARAVDAAQRADAGQAPSAVELSARPALAPLSLAQQRLWLASQLEAVPAVLHVALALELEGTLNHARLGSCLAVVTQRHEALRTTLELVQGTAMQRVLPTSPIAIERQDLRAAVLAVGARDARELWVEDEAQRPFELLGGPLLRVAVAELSDETSVLLFVAHHLVMDGASVALVLGELAALYRAAETQSPLELPAPRGQLADYALRERSLLAERAFETQLDYFRAQIGDEPSEQRLPLDRPRTSLRSRRAARVRRLLDVATTAQLRAFARAEQTTPATVLLAALYALLYRYGNVSPRVGVTVANRAGLDARTVGLFVNTLVLSLRVDGKAPLRDLLREAQRVLVGGLQHQALPFERLVSSLAPERELGRTPLFDVVFNHQPALTAALGELPGLTLTGSDSFTGLGQFDLTLNVEEFAEHLTLSFEYAQDVLDRATVERMDKAFVALVQQLVKDASVPVSGRALVSATERERIAAAHPYQPGAHVLWVHEQLRELALASQERTACIASDGWLSRAELEQRSTRLAAALVARGVEPEQCVGLYVGRRVSSLVAMLGVWKAGAAFVPLDPSYPHERLQTMVEHAGVRLVLAESTASVSFSGAETHHIEALCTLDVPLRATRVSSGSLAYVVFTSGSTGVPKGVAVAHEPLRMHCEAAGQLYRFATDDRALHLASLSFDASVEQWFVPLLAGGSVLLSDDVSWTAPELLAKLQAQSVTHLYPPTSLLEQLALEVLRTRASTQIRSLTVGGEAVSRETLATLQRAFPGARITNGYGPTETVITPLAWSASSSSTSAYAPIGRPLGARRAYVLDADLSVLPVGVEGELYVAGEGLARGYLQRPGDTAARFVPDPFVRGGRLYRTGDLAIARSDGNVEFVGRRDNQVKLRGYRVELGEVESQLRALTGVHDATALVRTDAGRSRLFGYLAGEPNLALRALRIALSAVLPAHMVPAQLVQLDALPRTPNGKVDARALRALKVQDDASHEAPEGETERALAALFQELLGVKDVGRDASFFELGGDSIVALSLVSRARDQGYQLGPRDVVQHQSVRALAKIVAAAGEVVPGHDESEPSDHEAVPLTPIQRAFFGKQRPVPDHYNQSLLLVCAQPLDEAALRLALADLVSYHASFRLRYAADAEGNTQSYGSTAAALAQDLLWSASCRDARELSAACERVQTSLSLADGPLLRALHARLADGSTRLLLVAHHLVIDGVSWRIVLADLAQAYAARLRGSTPRLPARTASFARWSRELASFAESAALHDERAYWQALLGRLHDPLVPHHNLTTATMAHARRASTTLSPAETDALSRAAQRPYRTRGSELLLTALAHAVASVTGAPELAIEVEAHGREDTFAGVDVSRTVGWFTTLYPLALTASGGWPERIEQTKASLREAQAHALSYGVLAELRREQASWSARRPSLTFNYLGQLDGSFASAGPFSLAHEDKGQDYDLSCPLGNALTLNGQVQDGALSFVWTYAEGAYRPGFVDQLAAKFESSLRALIVHCTEQAQPSIVHADVPLSGLSSAELASLPFGAADVDDVLALTPMQQGIVAYGLGQLGKDPYLYRRGFVLRGALDVAALSHAWQQVAARHGALRSVYLWEELERPVQVVLRAEVAPRPVSVTDLRDTEERSVKDFVERSAEATGFSLTQAGAGVLELARVADDTWWLFWTHHHVALDGWSMGTVLRDLLSTYALASTGQAVALTPLALATERDRRRDVIEGASRSAELVQSLAGIDAATPLPPSRALLDDSQATLAFAEQDLVLAAAATQTLKARAATCGVTLSTLVQAAWALLLGRHADVRDVVFGVTVSGRASARGEALDVAGLFINTLPLRVSWSAGQTAGAFLRDVQTRGLSLSECEHASLADIVRASGAPEGEPLFETAIVFENYPIDQALASGGALSIALLEAPTHDRVRRVRGRNHYPLSLIAVAHDSLSLTFSYRRDRLADLDVTSLSERFQALLFSLVAQPERRLSELGYQVESVPELTAERTTPVFGDVVEAWRHWADLKPSALAVCGPERSSTYAEADRESRAVAAALVALGVQREDRVVVLLPRSCQLVSAMLGVLRAGGVYLPLEPETPAERFTTLLRDAQAACVVTTSTVAAGFDFGGTPTVQLDQLLPAAVQRDEPRLLAGQGAYLIYTSGSTGTPKGVLVTHGALAHYVHGVLSRLGLAPSASMAWVSTSAADLGHTSLFGALCSGRALHVLPHQLATDPAAFASYMHEHQVGVLKIVPSHLRALLDVEDPARVLPTDVLVLGGEASDRALLDAVRAARPACRIVNHYGPTETTVGVLTCELDQPQLASRTGVPTGLPIANVYTHVLDAELSPVPSGVAGELFVGGATLARGYHGQPAKTAERFVPDPLVRGQRLYRTGDRVRLVDGKLEFLGRVDDQVKLRGYRVELGEVRSALLACDGVRDAAVVVQREGDAGQRSVLVAYYVPRVSAGPRQAELLQTLQARLPSYMVPELVVLDDLPRTANGKLDIKRLPARLRTSVALGEQPSTGLEQTLAEIWKTVLGVATVLRDDSFLALGGDSILSLRVIARARKAGLKLTPRQLAQTPTLRALAASLTPLRTATVSEPAAALAPALAHYPLSFAQERLWFLAKLDPTSTAYHVSGAVRLRGPLHRGALEEALLALVARHDVLRTRFVEREGVPVAVVDAALRESPLAYLRVPAAASSEEQLMLALDQAHREAQRPFDLGQGPLLRVRVLALGHDDCVLAIVFHHIVADGWSLNLFLSEFARLYTASRAGAPLALEPLPLRYVDYARWQRELLAGSERERQIAFWKQHLGNEHEPLALPGDRPRPRVMSHRGAAVMLTLTADTCTALRALARQEQTTLYAVVLAAFQVLLARDSGQRDVCVGVSIANRPRVETEGLLGFFVNTLVLRSELAPRLDFRSLVTTVSRALFAAQEHADLPFEQLVDALSPTRSLSHNPLFQVLYNHQKRAAGALALPELSVDELPPRVSSTQFDLGLYTEENEAGALTASFVYATDLFDATTMERMAARFTRLLEVFSSAPDTKLDDVSTLSAHEQALLTSVHDTARAYPREPLLPTLISQRLQARAEQTALRFRGRALTCGELERRSNALAHHLRAHGVAPDVLVGVCLERSFALLIAVLGIMKAGGAYVPLEPDLPAERLRALTQEAQLGLVLTLRAKPETDAQQDTRVLSLETLLSDEASEGPRLHLYPDNLAYVIFTSGSTGKPKAAANTHGALLNRLAWMQEAYRLQTGDVLVQKTPFGFDVSVWELFWPLLCDAELVISEPDQHKDPASLAALIAAHHITTIHFVPSMLQAFLEHPAAAKLSSLRRVICSGEALSPELATRCLTTLPDARLYNLYGPTEAAIDVTHWTCSASDLTVPIGHAIANVTVHVLDENLAPVPLGIAGELYLGGVCLARGYHLQPAQTAARFVPRPDGRGERLYRTGDRARRRTDGAVEYLGRNDAQVKIRGVRIELGEVEAQLRRLLPVRAVAAVVHEEGGNKRLVAYVEPSGPRDVLEDASAVLRRHLPEALIPARIIALERLPLTTSGKLDRKALPAPSWESERYVAPESERERQLARLWAETLGVARVGRHDDFFELGGHSLLATRLMARVESELGIALPLAKLFEATQLHAFAALVEQQLANADDGAAAARMESLMLELEAE